VRRAALTAAEQRLRSIAAEVGQSRSNRFRDRLSLEQAVASSPEVERALESSSFDSLALAETLARLRQPSDGDMPLQLVGAEGTVLFTVGAALAGVDPDPAPPLDSVPALGPYQAMGDEVVFWRTIPVRRETQLLGWIAQRRSFEGLGGGLRALLGPNLRIRMGRPDDDVWVQLGSGDVVPPPGRLDFTQPFTHRPAGEGEVMAMAAPFLGTPQVLVIESPLEAILQPADTFLQRMLVVLAVMMGAVTLLAWRLSVRIAHRLQAVASAADELQPGRYEPRLPVLGHDELGRLAQAFNAMVARVGASEAELRHRLEEVSALAVQRTAAGARAQQALEEAREASDAKSAFLAVVSHEIRTPTSVILSYLDLLQKSEDVSVEVRQEYLRRIQASGTLIATLVNDLLDLSAMESGEMRVEASPASATELVRTVVAMKEAHAAQKGVELATRACEATYVGDRRRVQQILLNLVGNAIKFTPAGGSVSVSCSTELAGPEHLPDRCAWARFDVLDSGVGIEAHQLESLFIPFASVAIDPALRPVVDQADGFGAGLGLSISRRLARLMEGDVTVESRYGAGSRFTLWLPAWANEHEGPTAESPFA
jgi:signal transduction histidine kinase